MKVFSANIEDFRTLYVTHLQEALDMERKIIKALPDFIEQASDPDLSQAFRNHLGETEGHAQKLEVMLQRNTGEVETKTCKVIDGLVSAASDTIKDVTDSSLLDIALIGAAQQVEHHEIAVYGTLRRWAEILGLMEDAAVLETIEMQEGRADELLSNISERVNYQAAA